MRFFKKALPHIVAILIFGAISALFFYPQFQGKALRQGDMVRASGMEQDIKEHIEKYDEHPQWAGNMFGGMPAYLINMNYDGRWVKVAGDQAYILGQPACYLLIAMASFYLMLLMFGVNPWLGIIGGIAYGLSTYFPIIIEAGHITKMLALAWVPALIGAIQYAFTCNRWLGAALAGIFASIEIATSHLQITYYFLFVIAALVINQLYIAIRDKTLPKFFYTGGLLAVAALLALGSNLVQLYYVAQHTPETIRGKSELQVTADRGHATSGLDKDYATQWSYGKGETFNLFIPNLMGGSSSSGFATDGEVATALKPYNAAQVAPQLPAYWGNQPFTSGPVYIGALAIFLFVLSLFLLEGRAKWWLIASTLIAILLAWGHNLMWFSNFMLDYFPLYNKFRVPSMTLVIVEFTVPLLALLGLQKLLSGAIPTHRALKGLTWSVSICAGFALFCALLLPSFMDFSSDSDFGMISQMFGISDDAPSQYKEIIGQIVAAMQNERATLLRMDALRSLLYVLLGAGALFVYLKGWLKSSYTVALLAIFVFADLFMVDRRFVKPEDFTPKAQAMTVEPTNADLEIMQDTTNYRVANMTTNPFQDGTTPYFHRSIGGYHAAKLRRYQDLIEHHLQNNNMEVYNMLNTKYFITTQGVVQNPDAAGSAWFVDTVHYVDTPDAEINALGDSNFNAHTVAIVDRKFSERLTALNLGSDTTATIELTDYRVNHLTYKYHAAREGLAVFSEIYYPKGWTATIDGTPAPYLRADYVLRAMVLPAGDHTVEWKFAAPHFSLILNITRASSFILLIGALYLIVLSCIKKPESNEN